MLVKALVKRCPPCSQLPSPWCHHRHSSRLAHSIRLKHSGHTPPAQQLRRRRERGASPTADRKDAQQVIPPAHNAGLDHIGIGVSRAGVDPTHLFGGRYAMSLRLQAVPEDVRDQAQLGLFTDRTDCLGCRAHVARRPDQLRVRITDRFLSEPTSLHFGNQHPARQAMVDDAASTTVGPLDRAHREAHQDRG